MSVNDERKNQRNNLNYRTIINFQNKKEKIFQKRNKSNYNYHKNIINQKKDINTFEDEYNDISYKKNSFININNICLNIIKVTSNRLYNNNYD